MSDRFYTRVWTQLILPLYSRLYLILPRELWTTKYQSKSFQTQYLLSSLNGWNAHILLGGYCHHRLLTAGNCSRLLAVLCQSGRTSQKGGRRRLAALDQYNCFVFLFWDSHFRSFFSYLSIYISLTLSFFFSSSFYISLSVFNFFPLTSLCNSLSLSDCLSLSSSLSSSVCLFITL